MPSDTRPTAEDAPADGRGDSVSSLAGEVQSVVFSNPETGWLVARVKAEREPGLTTVVGVMGNVTPGEVLSMQGRWKEHPRFGRQFEVDSFAQKYPATENGIIRYLSSGMIKSIGPTLATAMVDHFGIEVLEVMDAEPERLLAVPGIGKKKLAAIKESWEAQRDIRSLMLFLQTHEVPTTYAGRIFELWGREAVAKLKANPFELAYHIRGIGFRTADNMALKLGFASDAPERVQAAVVYALFTQSDRGHLFAPRDDLYWQVNEMLAGAAEEDFDAALNALEEKKRVVVEALPEQDVAAAVYLFMFYRLEREAVAHLNRLCSHPCATATRSKVEKRLPELEREAGLTLSAEQREAVIGACANKTFIITGGPGTGKTTITRMIVRALSEVGLKLKLCAPTGRAAKRMSEAAGLPAATLHRMLQYSPGQGFLLDEDNHVRADAVIVDEASMLDAQLFVSLIKALPVTCRLILVGDVNQLPSVGPGNVLFDLLASEALASIRLTHIFRQAMESYIVVNAHRVNQGELPAEDPTAGPPGKDFWWILRDEPEVVQSLILQSVCDRIPAAYGLDPLRDVQVLSPMHKGWVGTMALNSLLQERLNPSGPEIVRGNQRLRRGDRVLQTRNNYEKEVFNGDLGQVSALDPEERTLLVDFDGREVEYASSDLDELNLAYAVSVHKSQGSEYPAVVLPMVTQHYVMLQRNLLYTALTRARRLVVLVGSKKAVAIAVKNDRSDRRFTHLRYRLQQAFNG